jgi:hypothetical protein
MKITMLPAFATALLATSAVWAQPLDQNLLSNPGAETLDLSGWTILQNSGNGWNTLAGGVNPTPPSVALPHTGSRSFTTSYAWDRRSQEIDLVAKGFSASFLDSTPQIQVGEWLSAGSGGRYYLKFELRDASHNPIASWNHGTQTTPITLGTSTDWFQDSTSFTGYGTGARYIYFEDGGRDTLFWWGNYGTCFDDASAVVSAVPEPGAWATVAGLGLLGFAGWRRYHAVRR